MTASTLQSLRSTSARGIIGASLVGMLASALPLGTSAQSPPPDPAPIVAEATRAMSQGRPYRATRLLTPLFSTPGSREPQVVLLAARAAAAWEGWGTVVRLLKDESWLDRLDGGEGRALLARARLERGEDAIEDAQAAVRNAESETLGPREIILARAFDRANQLDSAAIAYQRAATRIPAIADWLRLRAAGVLADSAGRVALYREVSLEAATARIRWTEVLARERTGDESGAARLYEALGDVVAAARLKLAAEPDLSTRQELRRVLLTALGRSLSANDSRDAIGLLDSIGAPLAPPEELIVARRAAQVDLATRAAAGFARARPLKDPDQMVYGTVLARLGRHKEAMAAFALIKARELKTQAQYQRARSMMRISTRRATIGALRRVARGTITDSATASIAGYLAADLLVDEGDEVAARTAYLEVARRFPSTPHGSRAALLAAIIAFGQNEFKDAARELNTLMERRGDRSEAAAAMYWAGRALKASGDSTDARDRWKTLVDRFPTSYYALPARDRLGLAPEPLPGPAVPTGMSNDLTRALERSLLLDRLGLRLEARFELDRLAREAESAPALLPGTAFAFASLGYTARAYRLALRVNDRSLDRLSFPIPRREDLFDEARVAGVDPLLAASLIRQESGFDPGARSSADARGLMQVVPSVGAAFARADGLKDWDPSLLFQPELNVHFGLKHLATSLRRSPHLAHALAAYNAGTRPADEWVALPRARQDPEIFIERIQYAETRDYVRRIFRNLAMYRALYPPTT